MGSKLFVFAGLASEKSNADLQVLQERLETKLKGSNVPTSFICREKLLFARIEKVSYYISFTSDKNKLEDWYQMAKDFGLKNENKPVTKQALARRYDLLQKSPSNIYQQIHYTIGLLIMEEMEKFNELDIYSFQ